MYRFAYGFVLACVVLVIPTQVVLNFNEHNGTFSTPVGRVVNMFFFFTIQSTIMVGFVSALRLKKKVNTLFNNVLEHTALVCITVTGVVYHLLIAAEQNLTGLNVITNIFLHTIIPIAFVFSWALFAPHGTKSVRVALLSLLYPIGWAVVAMIRGPIIDYYPYSFMDVRDLGYGQTLITMGFVTLFFVVLTFGYLLLDRLFHRQGQVLVVEN